MDRTQSFTVEPGDDERLDVLIARRLDLSRTQSATLIANGAVTVDGRNEKASFRAEPGAEIVVVSPEPAAHPVLAEDIAINVVFEDDHMMVVDKAAGMVVHPAPGHWSGTLVNALKGRGQALADSGDEDRAGLVHRLDKDTSGLIVVAKSEIAHRVLSKAMAERRVSRRYAVLSWGHIDAPTLTVDKPIGRDPNDRKKMAVLTNGRPAKTDFVKLARFDSCELLRAHLHTGRTHQIRVHLSAVGHPVVGDDTYGGGGARRIVALPPKRHFLHAAWLVLKHPVSGELLDFRSRLPADLKTSLHAVSGMPELLAVEDPLDFLGFYAVDG
jgi:23S rRNA pseudouridine1911/1915/1917 synthase